jgi:hypothetical protein
MQFRLEVIYEGYDPSLDTKIEKIVGRGFDGAGFGFGQRDMSFSFKTKKGRDNAQRRLADVVQNDDDFQPVGYRPVDMAGF